MENYRAKGGKYSYFLKDLTLNLFSIEYIPYSKMSEIIYLFTGIEIDRRRIFDIVEDNFDSFANKCINQVKKELEALGINPGEAVHYDEEFIWINHQLYVRLTIVDALNRIIIADHIVPRENFNRTYIKYFLKISLKDLNVNFIVTDGDVRYAHIIEELGYEQHRCTFHMMKNLMDSLSKRHSWLCLKSH